MCNEVDIPEDFNYFIPNSVLSEMRRSLVAKMMSERSPRHAFEVGADHGTVPEEEWAYMLNISNRLSQQFYGAKEISAYELKGGAGPIMQCRHCIRYALGYCVKNGGERPLWQEPLSLVLGNGRRFRLEFDCQHCQMNVYAP
jgi:putative protease